MRMFANDLPLSVRLRYNSLTLFGDLVDALKLGYK